MPGAAAHAGICSAVLPLDQIAPEARAAVRGRPVVTPLDYDYLRKLPEGALRPRPVRRQAVSGREPAAAGRPQGRPRRHRRPRAEAARDGDAALTIDVVEAMTTNESFFFRDKIPFDHFRDAILPALLAARASAPALRIWCAAASTGQEPYSLAMCLKEMRRQLAGWRIEILATDLSHGGAREGQGRHLQPVRGAARPADPAPGEILHAGRRPLADRADIRAMVQYRQLNLLQDFSHLGTFDVIFCRNVLIYFDQETKVGVFDRIAKVTGSRRLPVLGAAETVVGLTDAFKPHPDKRGLYQLNPVRAPAARWRRSDACRRLQARQRRGECVAFAAHAGLRNDAAYSQDRMRQKPRAVARDRALVLADRQAARLVVDEPASDHRIEAREIRQRRQACRTNPSAP